MKKSRIFIVVIMVQGTIFKKGAFYLIHKACLKDTVSTLVISDDKIRSINISDFIVIGMIGEILPKLVEKQKKN